MELADELSQLIADIEGAKARVRIEQDDLKEDYLAGRYRRAGYTKLDCERKLSRMDGEVAGYEMALTYLYKRLDALEPSGS